MSSDDDIDVKGENCEEEDIHIRLDIYTVLKQKELSLTKFQGNSPQLCFRRYLVDWLAIIGEKLRLTHGMVHLGVALMDAVMDKMDFPKQTQLNLMAICCLYVAAKVDEKDNLIPRVQTLKNSFASHFEVEDFMEMELNIMSLLEWRLLIPTPVQFTGFFLDHSVEEGDRHGEEVITNLKKARLYLQKYTYYFLEVALQNHEFNIYLPSVVASATIAASRKCLVFSPLWSPSLENVTEYSFDQIEDCYYKLIRIYEEDEGRK